MLFAVLFERSHRPALVAILLGSLLALTPLAVRATGTVTLAWDPSSGTNVIANYNLYYGGASATYTNVVSAGTATTASVSNLIEGCTYYFAATAVDTNGLESDYSTEVSALIPVKLTNQPPTLNALANFTINEGAAQQTVNLSGITSGATNESQTLTVTASSSNTGLIPTPVVSYTSPNTTGSLTFTPVALANGSATITVTVNDGGASNNIISRSFAVTVNPVNQPPTLNSIANLRINANAGPQTISLSGISSGAPNETQTLTVTSTSSNPALIPTPTVSYTSPNTAGTLTFSPVANASGTATITVTVNDGGAGNNVVARSFTVTVNPANQPPTLNPLANLTINENAGLQTVNLYGISSGVTNGAQTLTVTAASSNPGLIPTPKVSYTNASTTGSLTFTPVASAYGSATITVTVNNGAASNNVISQSFLVTVVYFAPRPSCTYVLSLSPTGFTANAASGTFNVGTSSNCLWSLVAPSWITLSSTNGSGDFFGTFTVDANMGLSRTDLVSVIGGATDVSCIITQQGVVRGCVALLTPANGATVQGRRPQLSWSQSDPAATWYHLWVNYNGVKYFDLWIEGQTSWTATFDMPGANYSWGVQPWSPAGTGPWSQLSSFTIPLNIPVAVPLISPAGNTVSGSTQRYTWKADQSAVWYELYIAKDGLLFADRWFNLTNSVVDIATGNFAVDVSGHGPGAYQWWVRGWSPDGIGPWSSAGSFSIGAVTLLAPSNSAVLQTRRPQLSWSQSDPVATWFRLFITRAGFAYLDQWIEATNNWTATTDLPGGDYVWYVQAWSPAGAGPWSGGSTFTIQTAVPSLITEVSPSGNAAVGPTQRYTWKIDPAATWYELYIVRNGLVFYDQWSNLTNSVVDSSTGDFAVDVTGHGSGAYQWYVRGYSPDGLGVWNSAMAFQLP